MSPVRLTCVGLVACALAGCGGGAPTWPDAPAAPDANRPDASTGFDASRPDARPDGSGPDAETAPRLVAIEPAAASLLVGGGTAILSLRLDRAAPAGGTIVALASSDPLAVASPSAVTVPEGATSIGFRVRADSPMEAGVTITASLPTGAVMADALVVALAAAPAVGELLVNEVNYDVPATDGDANCDGTTESSGKSEDEFAELVNHSDHPIDLTGVALWDEATRTTTSPRFRFAAAPLGPGEAVVVFGGALGGATDAPWCTGLSGASIGDAAAFAGAALGLNNSGDTLTVTDASGDVVLDAVAFPAGADTAWVRSPDVVGDFVAHSTAPGHASDRGWTPGTLLSGAPFAAASPTPLPAPDAGLPDAAAPDAGSPDAPWPDATAPDAAPDAAAPDAAGPIHLTAIAPAALSLLAGGGTAILVVELDRPAPAGGEPVDLESADPLLVAVPAAVVVPEGASRVGFRVRADSAFESATTISASLPAGTILADVVIVAVATAPAPGELAVNEVNYDVPTTNGDANCNGTTESSGKSEDEFVELVNATAHPLDLTSVSLWDEAARTSGVPRFRFLSVWLGAGEAVVVFGGALGSSADAPWCTGLSATSIGDAVAFAGAQLGLNNSGDTLSVTADGTTTGAVLDSVTLPTGSDTALVRSPDVTGAFVKHSAAPGHATDRGWTPGTLLTGAPFAAASPAPPLSLDGGAPDAAPADAPASDAGPIDAPVPDAGSPLDS